MFQSALSSVLAAAAAAGAVLALLAQPAAAEPTSRYSDFDLGACKDRLVQEEGGFSEFDCPAVEGVAVFAAEGDLRQDIDFGVRNKSFDTFPGFNHLGPKIEWRLDEAGKPFAAIIRFMVDGFDANGDPAKAEVLAVNTIGTPERPGCPVGYVDATANRDANAMARGLADEKARGFRCGTDAPAYVGEVSPAGGGANGAMIEIR